MHSRIYVGGTFDCFHPGHVRLLARAHELGDVWVGLNTDEFAARYKRRPILTLKERTDMVSACRFVEGVVVNHGCENSRPAILTVKPRLIVHGDDWTGPAYMEQLGVTEGWLEEWGISLVYLPYTDGISTTDIVTRIRERDEEFAT